MVNIQLITEEKLKELVELARNTFVDTYAIHNTEADMKKYLRENFTVEIFNGQIKKGKLFYVAENENQLIGYIQLSDHNKRIELEPNSHLEIERLYVSKKHQRKNIGVKLLESAIKHSNNFQYSILWLGVWKKNEKAINFYKKNGFEIFGEHHFILGDDVQDDWLMKFESRDVRAEI